MYELKTKINDASIEDYINKFEDEKKRDDARLFVDIINQITNESPKMWGDSIIGWGQIKYSSSYCKDQDWFKMGYAPRKANHSFYIMSGFTGAEEILSRLGKHKLGKGCLYIKKSADINIDVLKELISKSLESVNANNAILCGM